MTKIISSIMLILNCIIVQQAAAQGGIFPVTPNNGDSLETYNPMFSWYLVEGINPNERVNYTLLLVEMADGQTADEAVNTNLPIMRTDNVNQQVLLYPGDAPQLKKNVWYAWQVQQYFANSLTAKSEAWKFIISEPEMKKESMKYAKLKKKNDGTYYEVYDGKIYFMLDEKYKAEKISVSVYDEQQRLVLNQVTLDHKDDPNSGQVNFKALGANFYELDLGALNKAGTYEMETFDEKGKRYILPFVVR